MNWHKIYALTKTKFRFKSFIKRKVWNIQNLNYLDRSGLSWPSAHVCIRAWPSSSLKGTTVSHIYEDVGSQSSFSLTYKQVHLASEYLQCSCKLPTLDSRFEHWLHPLTQFQEQSDFSASIFSSSSESFQDQQLMVWLGKRLIRIDLTLTCPVLHVVLM